MQIATLSYQYDPKENVNGDSRAKLRHRQVLTTISNPQKKPKQRGSLLSDLSTRSNVPLPPITKSGKRPNSIRIKGNSISSSSKVGDTSAYSFNQPSRSRSRQSDKSEISGARSRSNTPTGTVRAASKLVRLKFGYPVKLRSADFYGPHKSEPELRLREDSFVNDSVRSAHQSRRSSLIPYYEALEDPHLRRFFQTPVVLDMVRKTLNIEQNKLDRRSSKTSKIHNRSKSNDSYDDQNDDYHRIVSKGSSGYAKLNGYDCIPSYAPARHYHSRLSANDTKISTSQHWTTAVSHGHRTTVRDKYRTSADTSITSFPTHSANQLLQEEQQQKKKKSRKYEKFKQSQPLATSSPLRHPIRHLVEPTTSVIEITSALKQEDNVPEQKSEIAAASSVSQD